jgi:hypothetical protein
MKWITALQLDAWADRIPARTTFPAMIADLIRASADQISAIRFPNGDMGQVRGFDGVLESSVASTYVRAGRSIWEFGITDRPIIKANADFEKRTLETSPADRVNITFVFVSLRTWNHPTQKRDDWVQEKSNDGWKEVIYLDGAMIEDWLSKHPAVAARYARYELKLTPQVGAISTDEFWDEYSSRFAPALTESILLCARDAQAEMLLQALVSPLGSVHFAADSPDEVIAFAVAAIRKAPEAIRFFLEARTMIVETADAVRQLAVEPGLVFLPRGQARNLVGLLASVGPVVVSAGADEIKRAHEPLSRPSSFIFGKALAEMMGCPEVDGIDMARKCGRSLVVLARQKPSGTAETPEWVTYAKQLVPALLAGSWSAANIEDKAVLLAISGMPEYDSVEAPLRPLAKLKDPPIDRVQDVWKVRAPIDAFTYLAPMIGDADLQRFRQAITTVFGNVAHTAPAPEALFQPPSQRESTHSKWLRDGLMTTLLIIAALHDAIDLHITGTTPQRFVDDIVKSIQELTSDERFFSSFDQGLPLLAEAAPDPFVEALERLLEGDAMAIRSVFNESPDLFAPTSPHVNLLWALEVLAWDDKYLQRVATILAKLAVTDPGGKLTNRPINSLRSIFLPWLPNTNATVKERIRVLGHIVQTVPSIAWTLLTALLPKHYDTSMPTARPKFRDAGILAPEPLTYIIVWESQRAVVSMAIEHVGDNPERAVTLVKSMGQFEEESFIRALDAIEQFLITHDGVEKQSVWDALRKEANRNKKYADAKWSIKGDMLKKVDDIVTRNEPANIAFTNTWLFDDYFPDIPGNSTDSDSAILAARSKVIQELFIEQGVSGIVSLFQAVKYPYLIIASLKVVDFAVGDILVLMKNILVAGSKFEQIAACIFAVGFNRFGQEWVKIFWLFAKALPLNFQTTAHLLMALPDAHDTWRLVESFGDETNECFWREKTPLPISGPLEDVLFAIEKYLGLGRSLAAIAAVHNRRVEVPSQYFLQLLDAAIHEINTTSSDVSSLTDHYLEAIFETLKERTDITADDLAKREFAYLPFLDRREEPLTLHRLMIQRPELYISVICAVFNPATGDVPDVSERQKQFASAAYGLLTKLRVLPGQDGENVDKSILLNWCMEVQQLAQQVDRVRITDQSIGNLLAYAPMSKTDQGWPHESVRVVIETLESDDIEAGIMIERFNMRGVFTKAIGEGGGQERSLADQAKQWAKVASGTPRTSRMLYRIAESWLNDAKNEDIRAKKDDLRY